MGERTPYYMGGTYSHKSGILQYYASLLMVVKPGGELFFFVSLTIAFLSKPPSLTLYYFDLPK